MLIEVEISEKEKKVLRPFVERHDAFTSGLIAVLKLEDDNTTGFWETIRKFYPKVHKAKPDEGAPATINHPDEGSPWTLSYWEEDDEEGYAEEEDDEVEI